MLQLLFSKAVCWSSPHRYIHGIVFSWGSYSTELNSPSDNIKPLILIADNLRRLWMFSRRGGSVFVSARVKPHFCGACSTISYRCLRLCLPSSCFLDAGQARHRARVCLCGFRSCILSHGIPDRSPYIHTFFCLSLSFFLFFLSHTTKSLVATNRRSNLFQPLH